jgi:antirestriction protein ArdC
MSKQDAYDLVTARIIEALDAGIVPWHRPWKTGPNAGPMSYSTRKPYSGVNVWVLTATAALRNYDSRYWVTFKSAIDAGGNVRKGEKGTPVVFWKIIEKTDKATGETERFPLLRYSTVFNLDQCENVAEPETVTEFEPEPFTPIEIAERIANAMPTRPNVKHGGDRAYYSPALDYVQMPLTVQFESPEHYYSTLFHELVHSTGHPDRIGRKTLAEPAPFGSADYSREELTAEMGAAYLCGAAGIDVNVEHHASYIASWLKALENDRKMVVSAAGAAQKAADYIIGEPAKKEEGSQEPSDLGHSTFRRKTCPTWTPTPRPSSATTSPESVTSSSPTGPTTAKRKTTTPTTLSTSARRTAFGGTSPTGSPPTLRGSPATRGPSVTYLRRIHHDKRDAPRGAIRPHARARGSGPRSRTRPAPLARRHELLAPHRL